ncbi:Protein Aster-B [Podila humilis]|nr:Protein Aster-B [Podila humilis]
MALFTASADEAASKSSKVLGFFRKRSSANTSGRDRAKSMVLDAPTSPDLQPSNSSSEELDYHKHNTVREPTQEKLTKVHRKFAKAFPELSDRIAVPAVFCTLCITDSLKTPIESNANPMLPASESLSRSTSNTDMALTSVDSLVSVTSLATSEHHVHVHDYACALEREILWQGTLFVTGAHICFYGKHFGKTVRVTIDYEDLISIDKEKKMGVFPNSIRIRVNPSAESQCTNQVQTHKDYVLTSLVSRDQAYADIEGNWLARRHATQKLSDLNLGRPTAQDCMLSSGYPKADSKKGEREYGCQHPARSYSVITDEVSSSSETMDRPRLCQKLPSRGLNSGLPDRSSSVPRTLEGTRTSCVQPVAIMAARRKSFTSIEATEDKMQGNNHHSEHDRAQGGRILSSVESQDEPTSTAIVLEHRPVDTKAVTGILDAKEIQCELAQVSRPSFELLSLHQTTTEDFQKSLVSEPSYSVVFSAEAQDSSSFNPHRSESSLASDHEHPNREGLRSVSSDDTLVTAPARVPDSGPLHIRRRIVRPVNCGCNRHYKHAVISKVVSFPLELCFELLFSGMGAGLDDKLGRDTHRFKDGSTDIKISPWQSTTTTSPALNPKKWKDETRNLEYSVSFKVPLLANTSTACFEIQQVTDYSDNIILVHSESRTPNVPYGDCFSTVNQICMTWESANETKIQCFTEVKFKKSILWSGKVEAGSLEGSGGYYKEFISRLSNLADSSEGIALVDKARREQTNVSQAANDVVPKKPPMIESGTTANSSTVTVTPMPRSDQSVTTTSTINIEPVTSTSTFNSSQYPLHKTTCESEASVVSSTCSLLSQQILRSQPLPQPVSLNLPQKTKARTSLDLDTSPTFDVADRARPTGSSESKKKAKRTTVMESIDLPPLLPPGSVEKETDSGSDSEGSAMPRETLGPSNSVSFSSRLYASKLSLDPLAWLVNLKSLMIFEKSVDLQTETVSSPPGVELRTESWAKVETSLSAMASTSGHLPQSRPFGNREKFASTLNLAARAKEVDPQNGCNDFISGTQTMVSSRTDVQARGCWTQATTLFSFLVLGMTITALNMWHLFGIVSSMLDVVQYRRVSVNHSSRPYVNSLLPYTMPFATNDKFQTWTDKERAMPDERFGPRGRQVLQETTREKSHGRNKGAANTGCEAEEADKSMPLLVEQTNFIRAEIAELFGLLQIARQELENSCRS